MLAYIPAIYSNETYYSWICRIYHYSGYPAYRYVIDELMNNKTVKIDMDFYTPLNSNGYELLKTQICFKDLILDHTLFKELERFNKPEKSKELYEDWINNKSSNLRKFFNKTGDKRYLKYCPYCAEEDRSKYGETYWHTEWQLRGVNVCSKHKRWLIKTDIIIAGYKSPKLYVAERVIPQSFNRDTSSYEDLSDNSESNELLKKNNDKCPYFSEVGCEVSPHPTERECHFIQYLVSLFNQPFTFTDYELRNRFWTTLLETKYVSKNKHHVLAEQLLDDLEDFYKDCSFIYEGITELYELQKVLNGIVFNHLFVCQVLYFLNMSIDSLTEPFKGIERKKNYNYKRFDNRKNTQKQDWEQMDLLSIDKVQNICENIKYGEDKPGKVSIFAVEKALGFPNKRFDLLPECKSIIQSYMESNEEYCARKLVWAWQKVKVECYNPNWRRLRDLTNMRKEQVIRAIPFIEDLQVRNEIMDVINFQKVD